MSTTSPAHLGQFFLYYGTKYGTAFRYPTPGRRKIIEPFAGAAGYSLRHYKCAVDLYDVDPKVCGVWDYLIHAAESEILRLPTGFDSVRDLDIPQEAKWLLGWWININTASPCVTPNKRMQTAAVSGRSKYQFWGDPVKFRLAQQLKYIRHWNVYNKSYEEAPDEDAMWFIDPPYQLAGQYYRHRDVDYDKLAAWCRSRTGRVIVCENEGATWLPFHPVYRLQTVANKSTVEVVWTNF